MKTIIYKVTEADIQAEFYHQARLAGLTIGLETSTNRGRLDLIVMNPERDRVFCIIECKRGEQRINHNSRQTHRYKSFGLDFFIVGTLEDIPLYVAHAISSTQKAGITLLELLTAERLASQRILKRDRPYRPPEMDEDLIIRS